MKLLLVLLPLAFAAPQPEKRLLVGNLQLESIFHVEELKKLTTQLFNTLGSDETEQACEAECNILIHQDHLLHYGCPLVCHQFQALVTRFNLAPAPTTGSAKRNILDSLSNIIHLDSLKLLVKQLVDNLGSDATEKACEAECHVLIHADHLLQYACPVTCHSLQELVHKFNIQAPANPSGGVAKRNILDSLSNIIHLDSLKLLVKQLVDTLGSDATEKACEDECHVLIHADHLLQYACPVTCHSLQELVHKFNIQAPANPSGGVTKRNLLTSLLHIFNADEIHKVTTQLFNTLGSEATEAACETECNTLLRQDGLVHHGCPLLCRSFQGLVKHFNLTSPVDPQAVGKRSLLDSLSHVIHLDELQKLVLGIHEALGDDETEQLCEAECHTLIQKDHILQYSCPLICHSLEELLHHFNSAVQSHTTTGPRKRFLFNLQTLFGNPDVKPLVEQLYQTLGSAETEQNCETHCVPLAQGLPDHGSVTQYLCPLICNSFNQLLHKFDIHTLTGTSAPIAGGAAVAPAGGSSS